MTGFGTAAQQDAYIIRCLASGATAEHLADHLNLDLADVRQIEDKAFKPDGYWDEFCTIAENVRRKCFHCKLEAGLHPDPAASSNLVPVARRRLAAR